MAGEQGKQEQTLEIEEDATGGAVVALPDGFSDEDPDDRAAAASGAQIAKPDTDSGNDDDSPAPGDEEHPDDTDEVREAKRNRRRAKRQLARETSRQREAELAALRRQNQELVQRLSAVEQRTVAHDMRAMEQELSDAQVRVEYARMRLTQATEAGDAAALVQAQEELADAKAAQQALAQRRDQAQQAVRQPRQQQPAPPDPTVARYAQDWAKRHKWFDPRNNTTDPDSRVARAIDQALSQEGFDPGTQEYWDELDDRLQKYLPHRYTAPASGGNPTPRNTVGSSGREVASGAAGNGRGKFVLSAERVAAMKAAGAWDNPERRNRMIKQYMQYDRNHRS